MISTPVKNLSPKSDSPRIRYSKGNANEENPKDHEKSNSEEIKDCCNNTIFFCKFDENEYGDMVNSHDVFAYKYLQW